MQHCLACRFRADRKNWSFMQAMGIRIYAIKRAQQQHFYTEVSMHIFSQPFYVRIAIKKSFTFFHHWNYSFASSFSLFFFSVVSPHFVIFMLSSRKYIISFILIAVISYWFHNEQKAETFSASSFSLAQLSMFFWLFSLLVGNLWVHNLSQMWVGRGADKLIFLTVCNKCSHVDKKHNFFVFHSIRENIKCN